MRILAIDSGNIESGYCLIDSETYKPIEFGKIDNTQMLMKVIELDYDYTKIPPAKEEIFTVEEEKEINILKEGDFFGKINFTKLELRN